MGTSKETISIIIPTYNRAQLLDFTLRSVRDQNIPTNFIEVIVVDDGSTDDTISVIREYQNYLQIKYIYVKDEGYGVGKARNIGIHNATSDICLLIDAGVIMQENCVYEHLKIHNRHVDPISIIGYVYGFSNKEESQNDLKALLSSGKKISEITTILDKENKYKDIREEEYSYFRYEIQNLPAPWAYYWTCQVSINKNSLPKDEPFFDPIYDGRYGYEDVDLGYRLHNSSINIILNKEAKAIHYPHEKQESYIQNNFVNQCLFEKKHASELVHLFIKNGGTFGFNELVLNPYKKAM